MYPDTNCSSFMSLTKMLQQKLIYRFQGFKLSRSDILRIFQAMDLCNFIRRPATPTNIFQLH